MDKREKLRLKMVKHQNEAAKLRQEIATIDNTSLKKQIEELVGCAYKTENSWFRIERFDYKYNRYYGTVINMYGNGKNKIVQIEFNEGIFEDTINADTTKEITTLAFKNKLDECGKFIIKALDYQKQ